MDGACFGFDLFSELIYYLDDHQAGGRKVVAGKKLGVIINDDEKRGINGLRDVFSEFA